MPQLPRFQRTGAIEEIPMGRRTALYRPGTEKGLILNEMGSVLWELFNSPQDRDSLVTYLAQRFPAVGQAQLEADVEQYLEQLRGMGIIAVVEEASAP